MTGYTRGGIQLPFKTQAASYPTVPTPPAGATTSAATANLNALYAAAAAAAQAGYPNYAGYASGQYAAQGYQQQQRVAVQPQTVMDDYERESLPFTET